MCGDGEQPGRKRALHIVTMQIFVGSQKGFLCGIFSPVCFAEHTVAQIKDRLLIGLDQKCKRLVTALLRLEDPGLFLVHFFSCVYYVPSIREFLGSVAGFLELDWRNLRVGIRDE
jgi:hypothetical protein